MGKPAKIKTNENEASVSAYINGVEDEQKRKDSLVILQLMEKASQSKPKMWGKSLVGFGNKRFKSERTGREVDWFKIGYAPRKANLSLHLIFDMKAHASTLEKLGKHKTGSGCLYINKLADVDIEVLEQLIHIALEGK
ncbi:MAG: DUF1801 domain-containing protein [Salibacteraceae bacterium]